MAVCSTKHAEVSWHQMQWKTVAAELGSGHPCCAAVPVPPPPVPDTRQVRRAPLRRNEFERFGCTDSCSGCANARAGREQAVDHSEQCRSRMETILSTTTEGQMRLDQPTERFAQYAEAVRQPGEMEQRKRYRPEGEGRQPLGPPRSTCQVGGSNSSGSFMPAEGVPSSPTSSQTAKRGLEQEEAEMTDVPTEHQGEPKRRKEQEVADSSSREETSSDSEMGLMDVCTIFS